jgi:hypothetical protein
MPAACTRGEGAQKGWSPRREGAAGCWGWWCTPTQTGRRRAPAGGCCPAKTEEKKRSRPSSCAMGATGRATGARRAPHRGRSVPPHRVRPLSRRTSAGTAAGSGGGARGRSCLGARSAAHASSRRRRARPQATATRRGGPRGGSSTWLRRRRPRGAPARARTLARTAPWINSVCYSHKRRITLETDYTYHTRG